MVDIVRRGFLSASVVCGEGTHRGSAIPLVKNHLTEEKLITLWGKNVEYPMLKHKSILLAEQGRFTELPAVFERIRESCRGGLAEPGAEQHIARLRVRFCLRVQ